MFFVPSVCLNVDSWVMMCVRFRQVIVWITVHGLLQWQERPLDRFSLVEDPNTELHPNNNFTANLQRFFQRETLQFSLNGAWLLESVSSNGLWLGNDLTFHVKLMVALTHTHTHAVYLPLFSAQTGKHSEFYWGCQANRVSLWPSAPPVPDRGQLRPCLLLHLWQRAVGQKRRPHPRNRQRAMEPELLTLLLPVATHEFEQGPLCHRAVNGPEGERRALQTENGEASPWKSRSGRRCGPSAGRFPLSAVGESQVAPRGRRRHPEERLRSLHSLRSAGDLPDQCRGGGILWSDLLNDWDSDSGSARVKNQTLIRILRWTLNADQR